MKKYLLSMLAVVAMLLFAVPAQAQKASIYASYGAYTQMDATDMHDGAWGVKTAWGALNVGADFKIGSNFRLGPSYTFSSAGTKWGGDIYYHVIMLNAKFDYYRTSICTLYAHAGLGACISHMTYQDESDNKGYFAFQAVPLGARFPLGGGWNFFGEIGFGAQGLAQFGFNYNF